MKTLYMFVGTALVVLMTYFGGRAAGIANCRARVAASSQDIQMQIIQKQGEINAETLSRGARDIRRVLREKYTIAE